MRVWACINKQFSKQSFRMARGHQKAQSQAKAQEKAAKMKKQQGHNANDQKKAAEVALKSKCSVCMVSMQKTADRVPG